MLYIMYDINKLDHSMKFDPEKIKLNVSKYKNWRTGIIFDDDYLESVSKLNPVILTKLQFDGFGLLSSIDFESMKKVVLMGSVSMFVPLTDYEKDAIESILKLFNKFNIRLNLELMVGDLSDMLADLSKKVSLLERIIIKHIDVNNIEDEDLKTYIEKMKDKINNKEIYMIYDAVKDTKDDVVDYYMNVINKRETTIAEGIRDYYQSK